MKVENLPLITINDCHNYADVRKKLSLPHNGTGTRLSKEYISFHKLDVSHFDNKRRSTTIYETIVKECPVCGTSFETKKGHHKEQHTCSRSCSNTYFRSGENNPNWKEEAYRSTCFNNHDKKCVICGEENIVEVHHYDGNHYNNEPSNLIPLCPTHHQYVHSRFSNLVIEKITEYKNSWLPKAGVLPD